MGTSSRMSFDVGLARVGAARSIPGTSVVVPLKTYQVRKDWSHWKEIVADIEQYAPSVIYVGKPLHLNGSSGKSVKMAEKFASQIKKRCGGIEVRMVDERLSSSSAHSQLAEVGIANIDRKNIIDQAAAVVILEFALSVESASGESAGTLFI